MKSACKIMLLSVLICTACSRKPAVQFTFNPEYEVAGAKFSLKDINPNLPENWEGYNYVVIEYKISTSQRFHLGFTTDWGYNELKTHCYVPGAWNRLAIPLKFYTNEPGAAGDLAATYNQPRYTGWINLGGKRGPLSGVDSVGVRMVRPVGTQTIEIRNIELSVEDPGDLYLGKKPAIDEFGQNNFLEYPGKVHSLAELEADWRAEEADTTSLGSYGYSKYGGYLRARHDNGTGFFRVAQVDGRWWFVDPEGYLFLSVGSDCVSLATSDIRDLDKRQGMFKALPPEDLWTDGKPNMGTWNMFRRFGEDYRDKGMDLTIRRMEHWGLNTIANWSDLRICELNRKPFLIPLSKLGTDGALMGLCDIYRPEFEEQLDSRIAEMTSQYAGNPWLIGYFVANEPAWVNKEVRLCNLILQGQDRPIKAELQKFLAGKGDTPENRRAFILNCFKVFLDKVNISIKKHDPDHLNLGMRFGDPRSLKEDLLKICGGAFDVFSYNCYAAAPDHESIDRAVNILGIPLIIGEFHFGAVDHGMAQSLLQVNDQAERGQAYRYYTEQGYSHPALIGTGWFQWTDQSITGRRDGENYNCGIIDVTDRPYKEMTSAISATSSVLYEVHAGLREPFSDKPKNVRGGYIADQWDK